MKKGYIIIGIMIVIGLALVVLGIVLSSNGSHKTVEITMETNGGVPYEWQYGVENENVAKFVKSYEKENKNKGGMVGAPIKTNYVFEGVAEGETVIRFKYVNITDETVDKMEEYTVKVDKKGNISIVTED